MSKSKANYGVILEIGDGASEESFVAVPEVRMVPPIEESTDDIDVTHHGSGKYREYIRSGLMDTAEFSFDMNTVYPDTVQDQIRELKQSGVVVSWRIRYPNGMGREFKAYVKNIVFNEADAQSPDALVETVTLKLTGEITDISELPDVSL